MSWLSTNVNKKSKITININKMRTDFAKGKYLKAK